MNIVKHTILSLLALMLISIASCSNDPIVKNYNGFTNGEEVTFTVTIPGYALPTRADEGIDPAVTSLHLYLFDNQGHFTGIVEATQVKDPTTKDDVLDSQTNTTATYSTSIPQNTDDVHFIANLLPNPPDKAWIEENLGYTADAVIPHLLTDTKVYWGKSTFGDLTDENGKFTPTPVVLYRNYAKVTWKLSTNSNIVEDDILGWTLCNVPTQGTVAPFDISAVGTDGGPFHFSLTSDVAGDRFATMPLKPTYRTFAENPTVVGTDTELTSFDHTATGYGNKMYAVFQIKTTASGNTTEAKYYKIALIDSNKDDYDIKRNHVYTITFEDINPALGYDKFTDAATDDALAANDNTVDIQEILPELQNGNVTLSVVNGTVRYIDNLTTRTGENETLEDGTDVTKYQVNDIYINYTGSDALKVTWKENHWGTSGYIPETESLTINDQSGTFNGKPYTHVISFYADAFEQGNNGENHYKEGLIRVAETDGPLSRFVRVYIGEPISFRPLLISSDIPNLTDERISIVFNVPDSLRLPKTLYPIEIRFGSDRVDVEKNIYVESMKVEETSTSDQYEEVLTWTGTTDKEDWNWKATGTVTPTWNHKYVYTLDTPEEAVRQHRITLRTVNNLNTDFSVLMEGLSTVLKDGAGEAEAKVFNTRELKFHMQPSGEARRIMLDDGMYETRLVTAYKYAIANASGQTVVSIPYTLGTFDSETNTMTPATGTISSTLWVYYDPEVLEPCDENGNLTPTTPWWSKNTRTEDPEGNTYVTVSQTTAKGTLYFQTKKNTAENSLVFITARSEAGYGTYDDGATSTTTGYPQDYINTGENATAGSEYRSASAIISVKDKWQFNPAPSTTNSNFAHAEEFTMPYGRSNTFNTYEPVSGDNLLYVRIERPAGKSDVKLEIETEGKFQLLDNTNEYTVETFTYTDSKSTEQTARYDGYASNQEISTIKLTLTDANSDYCVLKFRALKFSSACTITLKSASGSSVPYETDYLKIVNSGISVNRIGYMKRAEYEARRNSSTYLVNNTYFTDKIALSPIARAGYVVRVYFPTDLDAMTSDSRFVFDYLTLKSHVLKGQIFTGKKNTDNYLRTIQSNPNKYTLSYGGRGKEDGGKELWVDILLQSQGKEVKETPRLEGEGDINIYRYSLGGLENAGAITDRDSYETWFTEGDRTNECIIQNDGGATGNEVFQANSPYDVFSSPISAMGRNYQYGVKLSQFGNMSIAVPKDNMYLTVVAAYPKFGDTTSPKCGGLDVITYNSDGTDTYTEENTYADEIDADGKVAVYQLGTAGEYILKRDGNIEFLVYYAKLSTTAPTLKDFGTISWEAKDTNDDTKGGTTSGTVTDNRISVSDFHEQLTLKIGGLTANVSTTLALSTGSKYKFSDGTFIQTVTADANGEATITLTPVGDAGIELQDGTFTLSGSDANGNVYNAQTVEVYVRPYVIADGLFASDGKTKINDASLGYTQNGSYTSVPVGTVVKAVITIPDDANTIGKDANLNFKWGYGSEYMTSMDANNNVIENISANSTHEFTWIVSKAGDNAILQSRKGTDTDILRDGTFGSDSWTNFWTYLTATEGPLKVGVGSWNTAVKYTNVKVTNAAGNVTYIEDGVGDYTTGTGSWNVSSGILTQTSTDATGCYAIHNVGIPADDYKLTCKATKTDGKEGFLIVFNYEGEGNYLQWNVGGWGNTLHTIESYGIYESSENAPKAGSSHVSEYDSEKVTDLIAKDVEYNIEITVKNGIATCTCTPASTGYYYMKYVYNIESPAKEYSLISKMENTTYEYYCVDATNGNINYKNGNNEGEFFSMASQQIQQTDEVSVTLNESTLLSTKYGSGQQPIAFTTTYPMDITIWWTPRVNNPGINLVLNKIVGEQKEEIFSDEGTINTKNISTSGRLEPGTYNIVTENEKEIWFYYIKLEPYTP